MIRRTFFGVVLAVGLSMSAGIVFAGDKAHPSQSEDAKKPGDNCKGDKSGKTSFRDCVAADAHDGKTPGSKGKGSKHSD